MDDLKPLIATHGPAVWRTVCRLLNHHEDALDCYQETFLAAWTSGRAGRAPDSWPAWLKTVATRKAIDRLRQRYRVRSRTRAAGGEDTLPPHRGAAAGEALDAAELRERVRVALAQIPERQAQAFWLRHVEQMSRREAAEQLGVAPGNVGVLVSRAAARLRELLAEPDAGDGLRRPGRTGTNRNTSTTSEGGLA